MVDSLKVMMAGGGTGGHVFPALAVADALRRRNRDCRILFVGTARGLEARVVPESGYPLQTLPVRGLKGLGLMGKLTGLASLPESLWKSRIYMEDFNPNIIFGTGGYASGPVLLQGVFSRRPTMIFEPNAEPGLTNRLLAPVVTCAATNFEETTGRLGPRAVRTGSPVRREFFQVPKLRCKDPYTILIFGGSRGAVPLNDAMMQAFGELSGMGVRLRIIHQTGEQDYDRVRRFYAEQEFGADVRNFIDDMAGTMGQADLVICRSGASTVAELAAAGRPSILVPYPHATDQHQLRNAEVMVRAGAARLVVQNDSAGRILAQEIRELIERPQEIEKMAAAAWSLAVPYAAEHIAELLERLAK